MKNPTRLFIIIAFFAGGVLSYSFFSFLKQDHVSAAGTRNTQTNERAPELKVIRKDIPGSKTLPTEGTFNNFLLKYAQFSARETREELERLLKAKKENKKFDYAQHLSIRYLALKLGYQSPEEAQRLMDVKDYYLATSLLEGWADKDFQEAMGYHLNHKMELANSFEIFNTLVINLTTRDPDRALKWVSSLPPGEREAALIAMAVSLSKQHPEKISEFIAILTPKEQSSYWITSNLASQWALYDGESFQAWSNTLTKSKQRSVLASALESSSIDLAKATEKMKELGRKKGDDLALSIIRGISAEEQAEGKALDWIMENKDYISNLPFTIEESVRSCSFLNDTPEWREKILNLPEGELRDAALSGLIEARSSSRRKNDYIKNTDKKYTDLLALAGKIGNSKQRDLSTLRCVTYWAEASPESAVSWLMKESQISPQVKQEILKQYNLKKQEKKG